MKEEFIKSIEIYKIQKEKLIIYITTKILKQYIQIAKNL